ncbi:MAG: hypothetical protein QOC98_751, partial [Frankiaceae bacterium]|nr:hypothetical protein [Frankiaceae bacterium]
CVQRTGEPVLGDLAVGAGGVTGSAGSGVQFDVVELVRQLVGATRLLPPRSPADPAFEGLPECARAVAADLEEVLVRVALARHFYNDAVRDLLVLRGRRLPRILHLYGRAQAPSYFEFDSSVPEARAAH